MKKKIEPDTASLNVIDQARQDTEALVQDYEAVTQVEGLAEKYIAHEQFVQRAWAVVKKSLFNGAYSKMPADSAAWIKRNAATNREEKRKIWTNRAIYALAPCAIVGFIVAAPVVTALAATAAIVGTGAVLRGVNHMIHEHRNDNILKAWSASHNKHLNALQPHLDSATSIYQKGNQFVKTSLASHLGLFAATPQIISSLETLPLLTQEFARFGVAEFRNPVIDVIQNDGKALTVREEGITYEQKSKLPKQADISYYPAIFPVQEDKTPAVIDANALKNYAMQPRLEHLLQRMPQLQQAFAEAGIKALTRPVAHVVTNDDLRVRIRMK